MKRIATGFLTTALLASIIPTTTGLGVSPAFANNSGTSTTHGIEVTGGSAYKTPDTPTSSPSSPLTCSDYNPDATTPTLVGRPDSDSVMLWLNPTPRVSRSTVVLTPNLAGTETTVNVGPFSADEWANQGGGWRKKEWSKRFTTLPDNINGGNWRTTYAGNGAKMKTIDVAQLVGVNVYIAHYYFKCEKYTYVERIEPCIIQDPTDIDPITKKPRIKMCTRQEKVSEGWVDRLWEVNTGVRYSPVTDPSSWAGFGSGLCVRQFYGDLSGPYNPDWSRRDGFLTNVRYDKGFTGDMPNEYDPDADIEVKVTSLPNAKPLPVEDGWVVTPYGEEPGSGREGWTWCIGLKLTLGAWKTPITDRGRYVGNIQFKSDWLTIAEVPRTPYKQKWEWLNDYISPSQANRRWLPYGSQTSSAGVPWGKFILLQVGRNEPTLPNGGIFMTSKNEGLFYQKSCMNGNPPGQAFDSDSRRRPHFGETGYKATPMTYIAPDPNAPLDRTRAAWTDRGDPAFYWQNECPGPTMSNTSIPEVVPAGWVPDTPNLALTCVDTKQQPGCSVFNRATGQTGTTVTPTNGLIQVRADGSTTRVNWAPNGAPYVQTDGGTVKRDSVLWQFRVDVPTNDIGLNSPSLTTTTDMNDRNQPYGPVPWADIDAQNANPTATWWDVNRWHDIPKVDRDESILVYPVKTYTTTVEYRNYTYSTTTYDVYSWVTRTQFRDRGADYINGQWIGRPCHPGEYDAGHNCARDYQSYERVGTNTATVKNPPPAGFFDNGTRYQRTVTTLDAAPSPDCTSYGDSWRCYTENIHDAASLTGVGIRFYENAVQGRHFQMTAAWNRTATINTAVSSTTHFGALMGSTMDGDIGWSERPSWSTSGAYVTKDVDITMMCVARPIGLKAERVAGAITERP